MKKIRVEKTTFYFIIAIAVAIGVAAVYGFSYVFSSDEITVINEYKRSLYDSTLCQYSCPLLEQPFQGKSQFLPVRSCVERCVQNLQNRSNGNSQFSKQDLLDDNFIPDVEQIVTNCRFENRDANGEIINEQFFSCVAQDLEDLKNDYSYLE